MVHADDVVLLVGMDAAADGSTVAGARTASADHPDQG